MDFSYICTLCQYELTLLIPPSAFDSRLALSNLAVLRCYGARPDTDVVLLLLLLLVVVVVGVGQGFEKVVVARHEVGHALVGAAVARLLDGFSEPTRLSIIPRTGGALGFTYTPPKVRLRAASRVHTHPLHVRFHAVMHVLPAT